MTPSPAPAMRRGRAPRRRSARRGAAGLLFFALVGLPMLFLSAALAVDTTLHIMTANQVGAVAEASAQAAAFQQAQDTNQLDTSRSRTAATQTFNLAGQPNVSAMAMAVAPQLESVQVRGQSAAVTVSYQLSVRNFTKYLVPGSSTDRRFTLTRTATVCTPGSAGPSQGHCAAPRAR